MNSMNVEAAGIEFIDENAADPAFGFESRQSRGGKNRRRRTLRNEPNFPPASQAALRASMEFPASVEFVDENPPFVHDSREAVNTARCSTGF